MRDNLGNYNSRHPNYVPACMLVSKHACKNSYKIVYIHTVNQYYERLCYIIMKPPTYHLITFKRHTGSIHLNHTQTKHMNFQRQSVVFSALQKSRMKNKRI